MTQLITKSNIRSDAVVVQTSRYINQNVIYYGEKKLLTFDTYNREKYTPTGNERIMLLTKGVEYRPDLVSYDVYGFVDNWWRILESNKMKDIWEFKAGKTIFIPDKII